MKSGNLNFLEPSGPLQACKGTALPLLKKVLPLRYGQIIISTLLTKSKAAAAAAAAAVVVVIAAVTAVVAVV
jgi:hypothetical protein